jgi:cytochrome o ubiquinol oxidase operon protein cyoD
MIDDSNPAGHGHGDSVPGEVHEHDVAAEVRTHLIWGPGIGIALAVLAIAQMGVHLVFFLHITTGPDNTNNVLALAFGVLIVFLVVTGSLWIMANLNDNMAPMKELMDMHAQH